MFVYFGLPTFINCTFVDNHATIGYGGAMHDPNGAAVLRNCIVRGNTTTRGLDQAHQIGSGGAGIALATYCNIQGGWSGTNIIDVDPQFVNPGAGNYALQESSPCRDVGHNAFLPPDAGNLDWDMDTDEPVPLDLAKSVRVSNSTVDMGAYEFYVPPPPPGPPVLDE